MQTQNQLQLYQPSIPSIFPIVKFIQLINKGKNNTYRDTIKLTIREPSSN